MTSFKVVSFCTDEGQKCPKLIYKIKHLTWVDVALLHLICLQLDSTIRQGRVLTETDITKFSYSTSNPSETPWNLGYDMKQVLAWLQFISGLTTWIVPTFRKKGWHASIDTNDCGKNMWRTSPPKKISFFGSILPHFSPKRKKGECF